MTGFHGVGIAGQRIIATRRRDDRCGPSVVPFSAVYR